MLLLTWQEVSGEKQEDLSAFNEGEERGKSLESHGEQEGAGNVIDQDSMVLFVKKGNGILEGLKSEDGGISSKDQVGAGYYEDFKYQGDETGGLENKNGGDEIPHSDIIKTLESKEGKDTKPSDKLRGGGGKPGINLVEDEKNEASVRADVFLS